jgi:DNA-binding response OmpR family regulator
MKPPVPRRRVLMIEDEPSIRNVLFVLLAGLGLDGDVAYDARQALSMLRQNSFDAILLDLRCSNLPPDQIVSAIQEIRPSLVGRVLVITGEVSDPAALESVEKLCLPHVSRNRVVEELWVRLRALLGMSSNAAGSTS